ncbi:phosphatidylglycerol:prolipoprotein diacylglycerol transferase [Mobilisporobacter senegalensis]|uniref:Phosphatidylglycerol--prolipoprotein diacylglyceryl transferase n=1 Tax=Mobilisporobacter senegalensis TaxID=1329262 RepID=A0A3N1XVS6_9FIRM|nr:prolipoprotein diacylglyceryl transferase [Mobilisporobacter senegalensis]ROR30734.1 phosphatidylglycerol:prolipoprotein diacylglycerol transferase [Mobilisporobacter senegalensis]
MFLNMSIRFPGLGIELYDVGTGIDFFGFPIAYYGMIIALGMLIGYLVAEWQAKRTGLDKDLILDFALYAIVLSVIGARVYYVIFAWDEYRGDLLSVFNTRGGGLAIYGGVIAAVLTAIVYSKIKKISFWLLADTGCVGLLTGQIIGRWGNFFNREAFGGYTDNIFAMQLKKSDVASYNITDDILQHVININGTEYIQVHPTFLYESLWNLIVLILILLYTKKKKFDGELILLYFAGYGLGRFWIEGLRTDQLLLWGTNLAVSQILSIILAVVSVIIIIVKRKRAANPVRTGI